jgi:hypothetical protein
LGENALSGHSETGGEKMSRYFLVLTGHIHYYPEENKLQALNPCITIYLDPQTKVTTRGSIKIKEIPPAYCGAELLANGKRYWIREAKKQNA